VVSLQAKDAEIFVDMWASSTTTVHLLNKIMQTQYTASVGLLMLGSISTCRFGGKLN